MYKQVAGTHISTKMVNDHHGVSSVELNANPPENTSYVRATKKVKVEHHTSAKKSTRQRFQFQPFTTHENGGYFGGKHDSWDDAKPVQENK